MYKCKDGSEISSFSYPKKKKMDGYVLSMIMWYVEIY